MRSLLRRRDKTLQAALRADRLVAGDFELLEKPFSVNRLAARVRALLDRPAA